MNSFPEYPFILNSILDKNEFRINYNKNKYNVEINLNNLSPTYQRYCLQNSDIDEVEDIMFLDNQRKRIKNNKKNPNSIIKYNNFIGGERYDNIYTNSKLLNDIKYPYNKHAGLIDNRIQVLKSKAHKTNSNIKKISLASSKNDDKIITNKDINKQIETNHKDETKSMSKEDKKNVLINDKYLNTISSNSVKVEEVKLENKKKIKPRRWWLF